MLATGLTTTAPGGGRAVKAKASNKLMELSLRTTLLVRDDASVQTVGD
jgi:hypothetical protein